MEETINRMNAHYNQYSAGTLVQIVGATITAAGILTSTGDNKDASPYIVAAGGAVMIVGAVFHIRSHRYFSKRKKFKFD